MRALSVKQPWAELIARGEKKTDQRTWSVDFRGPLLIVASAGRQDKKCAEEGVDPKAIVYGAAVCVVDLVDVTGEPGEYTLHLANPRRAESEELRGEAGMYEIDDARIRIAAATAKAPRAAKARSRRFLVVVADADPTVRAQLERDLEADAELGLDVLSARDGQAALAMIKEHLPDLCVLAPVMPKMGGFEVLQSIRKDPQLGSIKVLVVCDRALIGSGSSTGADACLATPFTREELHAKVRPLLGD